MIELFYAPGRASNVTWLLAELDVQYELHRLELKKREHLKPAYLAINPNGKVPAIRDQGVVVWEMPAICLYLRIGSTRGRSGFR